MNIRPRRVRCQAPSANHRDLSRTKRQLKQLAKEPPQALQKRQDTV